jgi:hypothetical protein
MVRVPLKKGLEAVAATYVTVAAVAAALVGVVCVGAGQRHYG